MNVVPIISDGCEIIYWEMTIDGEMFTKSNDCLFDFSDCKYFTGKEMVKRPSVWAEGKSIDIPMQKFSKPIDKMIIYQIGCDGLARWALIEEEINSDKIIVARLAHDWSGKNNGREAYIAFEVV